MGFEVKLDFALGETLIRKDGKERKKRYETEQGAAECGKRRLRTEHGQRGMEVAGQAERGIICTMKMT